jgi:hypothetical protein
MSSVSGNNFRCGQLYGLMKNVKQELERALLNMQRCTRAVKTDVKPDIQRLLKQNQF